jgi:hypothetical protein
MIPVMEAADLRDRNDTPARWRSHLTPMGAVVVEGLMRARGVVVREVTAHQTAEVPFVDHDDVIEAFPSNRPDDALGEGFCQGARGAMRTSVIPRPSRTWARSLPESSRLAGGRPRRRWGGQRR